MRSSSDFVLIQDSNPFIFKHFLDALKPLLIVEIAHGTVFGGIYLYSGLFKLVQQRVTYTIFI